MEKIRNWFIKKLIGKKPVIMNVTLVLDEPIMGEELNGICENSYIRYTERYKEEIINETKYQNA